MGFPRLSKQKAPGKHWAPSKTRKIAKEFNLVMLQSANPVDHELMKRLKVGIREQNVYICLSWELREDTAVALEWLAPHLLLTPTAIVNRGEAHERMLIPGRLRARLAKQKGVQEITRTDYERFIQRKAEWLAGPRFRV